MTSYERDKFIAFLESLKAGAENALTRFHDLPDAAKKQKQKIAAAQLIIEELKTVQIMESGS